MVGKSVGISAILIYLASDANKNKRGGDHNFCPAPNLTTSDFAPFCNFQTNRCIRGIKHTGFVYMHGLKMYVKY